MKMESAVASKTPNKMNEQIYDICMLLHRFRNVLSSQELGKFMIQLF